MTDVPDALVEKAAEALCVNAERRADQDITRRERDTARKIARAVLATVWEDSGLSLAFEQHATAIRAAARPVVDRDALDEALRAAIYDGAEAVDPDERDWLPRDVADRLLASGVVQDAADVRRAVAEEAWRLEAIARAHSKRVDEHGGTFGECSECGLEWPCPTYVWAADPTVEVICAWHPADCEGHDHVASVVYGDTEATS